MPERTYKLSEEHLKKMKHTVKLKQIIETAYHDNLRIIRKKYYVDNLFDKIKVKVANEQNT